MTTKEGSSNKINHDFTSRALLGVFQMLTANKLSYPNAMETSENVTQASASCRMSSAISSPVLVRLPNWVGDVCMSLPVLHLLADSGVPYVICARAWAEDLLAAMPTQGFIPMKGKAWEDARAIRAWRKAQVTDSRGLLLPDSLTSALTFKLAGLQSVGYQDDGRSLLLTWPLAKPEPKPHAVEHWFGLAIHALQQWGVSPARVQPGASLALPLLPKHQTEASDTMRRYGLQSGEFVLIAPTATGLHRGKVKVWPHFAALTQSLKAAGLRVVMCPPPNERDAATRNAPDAEMLPPLGLGSFAALASRSALVICNDSGVSHLAAATGTRQLTLFGVTDPIRTGPWTSHAWCMGSTNSWPMLDKVVRQSLELLRGYPS